jgi:thymidine phosphorylase
MATKPENVGRVTEPFYRWATLSPEEKKDLCDAVIVMFEKDGIDSSSVARLTEALVASGERWSWPDSFRPCLDVPSTGGPCSLTTLLCPYLLAGAGFYVPKLGVPGTTAGAIDVLGLIPSFRQSLDRAAMFEVLELSRVAHSLPNAQLAPADGLLFRLRKESGKKALPCLVVASILAKKIAVSCDAAAVEIRYGPSGNMGTTRTECEQSAELFVSTARLLGVRLSCVVTDARRASMHFVGRSESLAALYAILTRSATGRSLKEHTELCTEIAAEAVLAGNTMNREQARITIRDSLQSGSAEAAFRANIAAQGSSPAELTKTLDTYGSNEKISIPANRSGYLISIAFDRIARGINRINKEDGDRVGVEVVKQVGEYVEAGEVSALLRVRGEAALADIDKLVTECRQSFQISDRLAALSAGQAILSRAQSWE